MKKIILIALYLFGLTVYSQNPTPFDNSIRVKNLATQSGTPDIAVFDSNKVLKKIAWSSLPAGSSSVLEYANFAAFPGTGTVAKIYVDKATNIIYRWSGSGYVILSPFTTPTISQTSIAGQNLNNNTDFILYAESSVDLNIVTDVDARNGVIGITFNDGSSDKFNGVVKKAVISSDSAEGVRLTYKGITKAESVFFETGNKNELEFETPTGIGKTIIKDVANTTKTIAFTSDIPAGVTNTTTVVLSTSTLNSTYPTAITGFKVYCTSITAGKKIYEKTPTGWVGYDCIIP